LTVRTRTGIETAATMYDSTDSQYLNEQKLKTITSGLQKRYSRLFIKMLRHNAIALADFIASVNIEINLSEKHKTNMIEVLNSLSNHFENKKSFRNMKREDIISFLDSVRKPEISDPHHKWIGTYNLYRVIDYQVLQMALLSNDVATSETKPVCCRKYSPIKKKREVNMQTNRFMDS
jgi:hypothetical protein